MTFEQRLELVLAESQIVDISAVIRNILDDYAKRGIDPIEINHGDCLYFAGEVCKLVPGAEGIWDTDLDAQNHRGHMIIKYHNRWYDAECPNGVSDWYNLPTYASERDSGYRKKDDQWIKL